MFVLIIGLLREFCLCSKVDVIVSKVFCVVCRGVSSFVICGLLIIWIVFCFVDVWVLLRMFLVSL